MQEENNVHVRALCSHLINNAKIKKIDEYSIFRFLTNKKNKVSINLDNFSLDAQVEDYKLKDFIANVNPFYDYIVNDKKDYYKNYYLISHKLFNICKTMIEQKETPVGFRIVNADTGNFMSYYELDDEENGNVKNSAFYEKQAEAEKAANAYLKLYRYLEIEKNLQIWSYNNQDILLTKTDVK